MGISLYAFEDKTTMNERTGVARMEKKSHGK